MKTILIIDDDFSIRRTLCQLLESKYCVYKSTGFEETISILESTEIDLCLLDVNLVNYSGFDLCKRIREKFLMPIIFITINDDAESLRRGIVAGGDDYVTKPFSYFELDLRIMAQLRRYEYQLDRRKKQIVIDNYVLDTQNRTLSKDGQKIDITKTEYKIIKHLMENSGCLITREMLLYDLWDVNDSYVDNNTLSVNISRIRKKISNDNMCPIETVHGIGYRWKGHHK